MNILNTLLNKIAQFVAKLKRASVVKPNFFVLLFLLAGCGTYLLSDMPAEKQGIYNQLFLLLTKVLVLSISVVMFGGFLTSILSYRHYRKQVISSSSFIPSVRFTYPQLNLNNEVIVEVRSSSMYPLGANVKIVLEYDKGYYSPKFSLWRSKKPAARFWASTHMEGRFVLRLPEVRRYELKSIIVSFEDAFNLFCFHKRHTMHGYFTILPSSEQMDEMAAVPLNAKEQVERSDSLRPQEGEWLHFKSFEPSDDTRRIVWQLYARSKELVVRQQETQNMYASEIDVYATFYNAFTWHKQSGVLNPFFLSVYKNKIWSLMLALQERSDDLSVRFIPDQLVGTENKDDLPISLLQLASMSWHTDNRPSEYIDLAHTSICCISSLSPLDELKKMLPVLSPSCLIVFIPMSSAFKVRHWSNITADIFMEPAEGKISRIRWWLSPLRLQLERNEAEIRSLFTSQDRFIEV